MSDELQPEDVVMLPVDVVTQALTTLSEMTPGEYGIFISATNSREELLGFFRGALSRHEPNQTHGVGIAGTDRCIALTGNGPDAEKNARGIAIALLMVPQLIATLYKVWSAIDDAVAALERGDAASALEVLCEVKAGPRDEPTTTPMEAQ